MKKTQNSKKDNMFDNNEEWMVSNFSADNLNSQVERIKLEDKFASITEITDKFNRKSVSFQLSKNGKLHRWLKYKEGFSSDLVNTLIKEFSIYEGDTILDPFLGSGTTSFVASLKGINSIGFDILPISKVSVEAKKAMFNYDVLELKKALEDIKNIAIPETYKKRVNSIRITDNAYPHNTEIEISFFSEYFSSSTYSTELKNLLLLCILNSLEKVSYSAKDGQYLRWDYRCPKIIQAEKHRLEAGKKPFVTKLDKGVLPSLRSVLISEMTALISDIEEIQLESDDLFINSRIDFITGNALFEMPKFESNIINGVITSPPYCNRYDYTRTYALELVYLGVDEHGIRNLRQELLSCTVESKSKIEKLKEHYTKLNKVSDFEKIYSIIKNNATLNEINVSLIKRSENGDINNKGVLKMVDGYFTELTFIFAELFRLCKSGSFVAFVNDNVRYGGEVIPVDFLSSELAESIGFIPVKIYTLKQLKGNSSQQMAKYGRIPLRKSITIWKKP